MDKLTEQERELYDALPDVVEGHLTMVRGLLDRLGATGDGRRCVEEYVDDRGLLAERLTDLGRRTLAATAQVAEGLDTDLWEITGQLPRLDGVQGMEHLEYLREVTEDASGRLTVVAAALRGALEHPHPERVLWRAYYLLEQPLEDLRTWRLRAKKPKKEAA